jgi:hypothetical protein
MNEVHGAQPAPTHLTISGRADDILVPSLEPRADQPVSYRHHHCRRKATPLIKYRRFLKSKLRKKSLVSIVSRDPASEIPPT